MHNKVLILESSAQPMIRPVHVSDTYGNISESTRSRILEGVPGVDDKYVLVGACANFKQNRNKRLYDRDDYMHHAKLLKSQLHTGILGELNHNKDYMVDMRGVCLRVLDIWYDEVRDEFWIKIVIPAGGYGDNVRGLIDIGCPIHISSRASGYHDKAAGKVKIGKLYTYDVVYIPGFDIANMNSISNPSQIPGMNEAWEDNGVIAAMYEWGEVEEFHSKRFSNQKIITNTSESIAASTDMSILDGKINKIVHHMNDMVAKHNILNKKVNSLLK